MANRGLNICLVDDDRIYQFTARKIMESVEFVDHVDVFSNGEEAINFLGGKSQQASYLHDVIFLDINMPVMNGWEFLEAFRAIYKQFKKPTLVFMVSSSVDESDINRSRQSGLVSRYLNKPVSREKFEQLLQPVIDDLNDREPGL